MHVTFPVFDFLKKLNLNFENVMLWLKISSSHTNIVYIELLSATTLGEIFI